MDILNYIKYFLLFFIFFSCKKEKYFYQESIILKNWNNKSIKSAHLILFEKNTDFVKIKEIDSTFTTFIIKGGEEKGNIELTFKKINELPIDKDFILKINNSEYKIQKIKWTENVKMAGMVKWITYSIDSFNMNNKKYSSDLGRLYILREP
ncbi:hypothetical protein V3Q90_13040 [Flavobacterium oreochromis]|uniref:hypothetical protein n=1 Tax=Flavobacterium oreochromis TaxID=2906078 RepID=UPI0013F663C1